MKIKDLLNKNVYCLGPDDTVNDCVKLMREKHIGCVPVCNNKNNVIGLITDRDLVLRSVACNKDIDTTPINKIMTCNVICCNDEDDIETIEEKMSENQIRRLPIVDKNNKIVGIVSLGDLAKNQYINNDQVNNTLENICKDSIDNKNDQ